MFSVSSKFSVTEYVLQDDAEFVRLVAEINELHKERREGSKRMDRIIQQLHDLTISSTEIVSEYILLTSVCHFMSPVCRTCSLSFLEAF